jgi:N-acetylmuramoyl-L-alanine amidase
MFVRLRAVFAAVTALGLLAASQVPARAEMNIGTLDDVTRTDLMVLAPTLGDEDVISTPGARGGMVAPGGQPDGRPSEMSLRELVNAIVSLPAIDLSPEVRCLAVAVYFEARGEPLEGQLAVAQVIRNRTQNPSWPREVCDVVYQPKQFSFTSDRHSDKPMRESLWRTAQAIAIIAATDNWSDVVKDATHFHATRVSPGWSNLRRVSVIGNHIFYR